MKRMWSGNKHGVSLLELTFAMAILATALGVTARSLVSYYVALEVQERRALGIQHCRTVLGTLREIRDASGQDFIETIPLWIADQEGTGDEAYAELIDDLMPGELVTTACTGLLGGGEPADPMHVMVSSAFPDMLGRTARVEASTILTRQD